MEEIASHKMSKSGASEMNYLQISGDEIPKTQ